MALDPGNGAAHATFARIHAYNWRGAQAREFYERALELSPNDPEVLIDYAFFSAVTGRKEDAIRAGHRAIALDPNNGPRLQLLSYVYTITGDRQAGIEAGRRAVEVSPTFRIGVAALARLELGLGHHTEALKTTRIAEALLQEDTNPVFLGELTSSYGLLGRTDDARRMFSQLEERAETQRIPHIAWVLAYTGLGDDERALQWATRVADSPEPYVGYFAVLAVAHNLYGVSAYDEPPFQAVRKRLGYTE